MKNVCDYPSNWHEGGFIMTFVTFAHAFKTVLKWLLLLCIVFTKLTISSSEQVFQFVVIVIDNNEWILNKLQVLFWTLQLRFLISLFT